MQIKTFYGVIFFMMALFYSSCAAIETIFKAGVWSGVIIVVLVIGLVVFIISKLGRK
jgi:hypothetical protein